MDTQEALQVLKESKDRELAYNRVELMAWRLAEYLATRGDAPVTEEGLAKSIGLLPQAYRFYRDGTHDYKSIKYMPKQTARETEKWQKTCITIYRTKRPELLAYYWFVVQGVMPPLPEMIDISLIDAESKTYSEVIANARMWYREDIETRVATDGKIGSIMRAKVVLGWQDEKTVTHKLDMPQELIEERLKLLDES